MNNTETNEIKTRAELRRIFSEFKRSERYEKSGFLDNSRYVGVRIKPNKYSPHVGNKQKGIAVDYAS